jgi:hypothetical protein
MECFEIECKHCSFDAIGYFFNQKLTLNLEDEQKE